MKKEDLTKLGFTDLQIEIYLPKPKYKKVKYIDENKKN